MSMPELKGGYFTPVDDIWMARWKYSDETKGKLIERALQRSGYVGVLMDDIYSVDIVGEDIKGNPNLMTIITVNIGNKLTQSGVTSMDYVTERATSLMDIGKYSKMRDDAFKTITSIMGKMRTPILFNSQNPITLTPCQVDGVLQAEIATVQGDFNVKNLDFGVIGSISDVIQMYHDAESMLLKKLGIPATFLSRSSGMGEGEVDDASAMDDIIRERELGIRKGICNFLGITVEWALGSVKVEPEVEADV